MNLKKVALKKAPHILRKKCEIINDINCIRLEKRDNIKQKKSST